MNTGKWNLRDAGEITGPFSADELRYVAARGKINADAEIQRVGENTWQIARRAPWLWSGLSAPQVSEHATSGNLGQCVPGESVADNGPPPIPANEDSYAGLYGGAAAGLFIVLLVLLILWLWPDGGIGPGMDTSGGSRAGHGSSNGHSNGTSDNSAANEHNNDSQTINDPIGDANSGGDGDSGSNGAQTNVTTVNATNGSGGSDHATTIRTTDSPITDSRDLKGQDNEHAGSSIPDEPGHQTSEQTSPSSTNSAQDTAAQQPPSPGARNEESSEKDQAMAKNYNDGESSDDEDIQLAPPPSGIPRRYIARFQRGKLAKRNGGTEASEAAVNLGLKWLANHQMPDGRWSLRAFHQTGDCNGACVAGQGTDSDTAATGLALMAFLGAGNTHKWGKHKDVVKSGLDWLRQDQDKNGSFRSTGAGTMYAQAMATVAVCEALAMTRDKRWLGPTAKTALRYSVVAQGPTGGWRYNPWAYGDTSVTGWVLLGLESGRQAKIPFNRNTSGRLIQFLDSVQANKVGSRYAYQAGGSARLTMTAEGLLCRLYTGWMDKKRNHTGMQEGVKYLLQELPNWQGTHQDFYYWYYATQVLYHYGGEEWNQWNEQVREMLVDNQLKEGHQAGSWLRSIMYDQNGGRVYTTALALCTLEVYYRNAKLMQR